MRLDLPTFVDEPTLLTVAVLGAGNGGKAVAADLALQGRGVRLFEWPEYRANVAELLDEPTIEASGELSGSARLDCATCDLGEALEGVDLVLACVQGPAHGRLAADLAPLLWDGALVVLNPGSGGGSLELRRTWAEAKLNKYVVLAETGTLTHCARATGPRSVHVSLRVRHIAFAALPGAATGVLSHDLGRMFPGLAPRGDVLEVALCNGNPVIHPAIMLANLEAIRAAAGAHRFYADGVTPQVAETIARVDGERLALGQALGYDLLPEPAMCVAQGYAESADYCACYRDSAVFGDLVSPPSVEHRYLHEDVGLGLVLYATLGDLLGVPTPQSRELIAQASAATGRDYLSEARRTPATLGIAGLTPEQRAELLQAPRRV